MRIGVDARLLAEPLTGIGRYTAELSRALIRHKADFFLYTPKPPLGEPWESDHVVVRAASCHGQMSKLVWSQTLLPYWAQQDDLDVFWGATHRLPRYLPSKIARVVTIHDLVWKYAGETMRPLSRWLESKLAPEAVRLADRIMADSHSTAEALEANFPEARGRVRVVYLGATRMPKPEPFSSLSTLGIDRPYFLFVGTLEPRKNLQRLLQAFASLPEAVRNNTLMVIAGGKGWGDVDVRTLLAQHSLERQVVVTGYVTDTQLATLYAHARFLAMPSLYEGFGLPLVEAMSCGVPVLTSNSSSLPEVAGDAGMLVDALDERSIASGLAEMLCDDAIRDGLATRARTNAERFSWERAAEQAMDVFHEALAERRAQRGGLTV